MEYLYLEEYHYTILYEEIPEFLFLCFELFGVEKRDESSLLERTGLRFWRWI